MKTVLITGAASGLGKALVSAYSSGSFMVVAVDIGFSSLQDLRPSQNILLIPMDVSSTESVELAALTVKNLGVKIDLLINNAGIFEMYPLSEQYPEKFSRVIQINTIGPVRLIRAFLPDLVTSRGMVIQISSESVKFPGAFQPYQISKIALEAYSRSVRQELALKGVKLVIIRPGAMQTGLFGELNSYHNPIGNSIFEKEFMNFTGGTTRFVGRIIPAEQVAGRIYRISKKKRPKYIYRMNNNPVLTLVSLLPARISDRLVVYFLKKK
jgi:NAD(P)-dependent dehydrogenase (short-subunit alcohol dehydrogenase family)